MYCSYVPSYIPWTQETGICLNINKNLFSIPTESGETGIYFLSLQSQAVYEVFVEGTKIIGNTCTCLPVETA